MMDFKHCVMCKCGFEGKAGVSAVQLCNSCALNAGLAATENFRVEESAKGLWKNGSTLNNAIDKIKDAVEWFKKIQYQLMAETCQKYHELNKSQIKLEEKWPVHYVTDIFDDNAWCGEYTWKQGMSCTMNIFDVTCGCCAEKFYNQKEMVKWSCGHLNRKSLVGDCPECHKGMFFTGSLSKNDPEMVKDICKQESWRDRKSLL
jgi:hypothetical protein